MYNIPQTANRRILGTFALVFFGEGAICADQFLHGRRRFSASSASPRPTVSPSPSWYRTLGHISGGHFKPRDHHRLLGDQALLAHSMSRSMGPRNSPAPRPPLSSSKPSSLNDTWRAVALGTPELVRSIYLVLSAMILEAVTTFFLVLDGLRHRCRRKGDLPRHRWFR